MSQTTKESVFNLCKYILSCSFRNDVKSAINGLTRVKDGDESNRSMIGYYARHHRPQGDQFKNYLMIARDQHTFEPPLKFPNWDFSLLEEEARLLSSGHNTLKYIDNYLVHNIYKHFPSLLGLLDVYGSDAFEMPGCSDQVFPINEALMEDLSNNFRNARAVQKLYEADRTVIKMFNASAMQGIIAIEEKIGSLDMDVDGVPEDIIQMVSGATECSLQGRFTNILLTIIAIRATLKTINQILFQSFYIDKIITVDQNNIYKYEDGGSNVVSRYGSMSYQLSDGVHLLHPREIFLIVIKTRSKDVKKLAMAGGMQVRFGGNHGESVDVGIIFLDSDLNPYPIFVR